MWSDKTIISAQTPHIIILSRRTLSKRSAAGAGPCPDRWLITPPAAV